MRKKRDTQTPELDMNPMVDMAFLLVCFFMLSTTFKTLEPVTVEKPTSTSELKIPERNIMKISVGKKGRIFFGIDNKFVRLSLLDKLGVLQDATYTQDQRDVFSLQSGLGMPFSELGRFLDLSTEEQMSYTQLGIPCNDEQNELRDWILSARLINPSQRIAVVADKDAPYEHVRCVINTLKELKIYRFNIITDLE